MSLDDISSYPLEQSTSDHITLSRRIHSTHLSQRATKSFIDSADMAAGDQDVNVDIAADKRAQNKEAEPREAIAHQTQHTQVSVSPYDKTRSTAVPTDQDINLKGLAHDWAQRSEPQLTEATANQTQPSQINASPHDQTTSIAPPTGPCKDHNKLKRRMPWEGIDTSNLAPQKISLDWMANSELETSRINVSSGEMILEQYNEVSGSEWCPPSSSSESESDLEVTWSSKATSQGTRVPLAKRAKVSKTAPSMESVINPARKSKGRTSEETR